MRFSRLILLVLGLALALLLGINFSLSVMHSRHYLSQQFAVHSQDTATALGLSLASAMQHNDQIAIASLIKAIGDGGYFQRIRVYKTDGSVQAEHITTLKVAQVPSWFVQWLPLEAPTRSALIMSGWREAGHVEVSSNPGYAYQQLWNDAQDLLIWFSVVGVVALILLALLARSALKPLAGMQQQALAISVGDFSVRTALPWAHELRNVVAAMNQMTNQVDIMLADKVKAIEKLEIASYQDELTGLYTRSFLNDRVNLLMHDSDTCECAALLLIRLGDLAEVNKRWGYSEGDILLQQLAALLRAQAQHLQGVVAARTGGPEFMLLVQEMDAKEALMLANSLLTKIRELASRAGAHFGAVHIGIGFYDSTMPESSLLFSQADMALRAAERQGQFWAYGYASEDISHATTFGASHWRTVIERALARRGIILYEQVVQQAATGAAVYYELLARIRADDGRVIGAGAFIPMAHRLGLAMAIDRAVVEHVLAHTFTDEIPRAFNLSLDSIKDQVFISWLQQRLRESKVDPQRILIELPERAAAEAPEYVSRLLNALGAMGVRFGFDHVGIVPEALTHIRHLRPLFLKCDESLVAGMLTIKSKRALLEQLMSLSSALGSIFIVSGIETEEMAEAFRAMGANALQGRVLGKPTPTI